MAGGSGSAPATGHGPGCACCQGRELVTPADVTNPAGRPAITYRVGDHGAFLDSMLANLSNHRGLDRLTTRDTDDFAIALLDAWAVAADVVTFYQERIANEGYLGTATERRSLAWLAAGVGHRPAGAVAAAGLAAFELETAAGAPAVAAVPVGTAIQSLPGPGEQPQTYETTAGIEARPAWNGLRLRRTTPAGLQPGDRQLTVAGTRTGLTVGQRLAVVTAERERHSASTAWDVPVVVSVTVDSDRGVTVVGLDRALSLPDGPGRAAWSEPAVTVHALTTRAQVFGANAIDWKLLPDTTRAGYGDADSPDWPCFESVFRGRVLPVDDRHPEILAGSWLVLTAPAPIPAATVGRGRSARPATGTGAVGFDGPNRPNALDGPGFDPSQPLVGLEEVRPIEELYRVVEVGERGMAAFGLTGRATEVTLQGSGTDAFTGRRRDITVHAASARLTLAPVTRLDPVEGQVLELDDPADGLAPGRVVIVRGPAARLRLAGGMTLTPDGAGDRVPVVLPAETVVTATGPSVAEAPGVRRWPVEAPDGTRGTVLADPRDLEPVPAPAGSRIEVEAATIATVGPGDRIELTAALSRAYDRWGTTVAANVAPVTHGRSVAEVLGSARAASPWLRFALRQRPLTRVPSPTGGSVSTLTVRVNGVAWAEVDSLALAGPHDQVYATEEADDGTVTVLFGDGLTGARPPTGVDNVTAEYRVGAGRIGLVAAGQLSLLVDRPLGVKGVANPLAPDGAADPETADLLRATLPGTVTSFDRLVSLLDHRDFALAFPGVALAEASWLWNGTSRVIGVTVAGEAGEVLSPTGTVLTNLRLAMAAAAGHVSRIEVVAHQPVPVTVVAGIFVDPAYDPDQVLAEAQARLLADFGFARRRFAQPLGPSDVARVLHGPGVLGVDLDVLAPTAAAPAAPAGPPPPRLLAPRPARLVDGAVVGAELLVIDPTASLVRRKT